MHILIYILILAICIAGVIGGARLPKPFRERSCQGKGWLSAFPNTSKNEIRKFLSIFVDAFAFREKDRLNFNPQDTVMSIYKALYPYEWLPDALELETLTIDIETNYGIKIGDIWSEELTLGELFRACKKNKVAAQQSCAPDRRDERR